MLKLIARCLLRRELQALNRYRVAGNLAARWLDGEARETAEWIQDVGEGARPYDIGRFRDFVRDRRARPKARDE